MSDRPEDPEADRLVFEYDLDAEPEKVWRAISVREYRERWLPQHNLADQEALSLDPGREIRYRMRDSEPPYLESVVTFQLFPTPSGGTSLRIIHELADGRFARMLRAANGNSPPLMRAA